MTITIVAAGLAEKPLIENLYPLYLHDLSEFLDTDVDDQGRFIAAGALDQWWERDALHPFLIRVDGRPAGFAFVCGAPHVSKGRDYRLNEFFILRKHRRRGVGRAAAIMVFDRFQGDWELAWIPENLPAASFWPRVVAEYAPDSCREALVMESPDEGLPGLSFSNR